MGEPYSLTVDILGNLHRRVGFLEGAYLVDISNATGDTSGTYTTKPVAEDSILISHALEVDERVMAFSSDGTYEYELVCLAKRIPV
jgi:hypothetical protein